MTDFIFFLVTLPVLSSAFAFRVTSSISRIYEYEDFLLRSGASQSHLISNVDNISKTGSRFISNDEIDIVIAQDAAGRAFILVYVAFSILAGAKEFLKRFKKWSSSSK